MLRIITILLCWLVASLAVTSVYAQRTGDPEKDAAIADKRAAKEAAKRGTPLRIADNAPDRYTVVKGDTLWAISTKYLLDPWRWPELWRGNRDHIKNPHLIYPGDVLVLDRKNGTLRIERGPVGASRDGKLEPSVRVSEHEYAIPVLPANVIEPFIVRPLVIDVRPGGKDPLQGAPMIIGGKEGRSLIGSGDAAYVTGLKGEQLDWSVFRPGKELKDPVSGEVLGLEAVYLGKAKVTQRGEPAEVAISGTKREIQRGDRLVPAERLAITNYTLRSPTKEVDARVVSIYGAVEVGGKYSIITLNRGKDDGIENGNVLALFHAMRPMTYKDDNGKAVTVQPSDDRYGLVTVFRVADRLSYALVMHSTNEIMVGDALRNP